jgi:hypothetical protein
MSIRGHCPKCNAPLTADDLRVAPPTCPTCKTKLQVVIKAEWTYTILSLVLALAVAGIQGHESIGLGFWVLIYAMIILFIIKFYRWELHLPMKILEVPNYQMWSSDTSANTDHDSNSSR